MIHTSSFAISQRIVRMIAREPSMAWIASFLERFPHGQLYLAGGALRDNILEKPNKDFDFVARGVSPNDLEKFLNEHGAVNLVGAHFGVFKFHPRESADPRYFIDVALPRTEHPKGTGGYRDVSVASDPSVPIETDLARRDFTFNAIACDLRAQTLHDPYGGIADVEARIVRTVGDAKQRFQEDFSRVLRALRFAVALNATIDPATWRAAVQCAPRLMDTHEGSRIVPPETIGIEFLKAFHVNPALTLELWDQSGALAVIIPELVALKGCTQSKDVHSEGDVWAHTMSALAALETAEFHARFGVPNMLVKLGTLFHDAGKPSTRKEPDTPQGRIHFWGHAEAGARIVRALPPRIKFDAASTDSPLYAATEDIAWIVDHHMICVLPPGAKLRKTAIENVFLNDPRGTALRAVCYADESATIFADGRNGLERFEAFDAHIGAIEKIRSARAPRAPLVSAQDLTARGVAPGQCLGALLEEARELELGGEQDKEKIIRRILNLS